VLNNFKNGHDIKNGVYFFNPKSKILFIILCILILLCNCSTRKNTKTTRLYHSVNTRYNVYFNANESYKEALKSKEEAYTDTLSQMIDIYPVTAGSGSSSSGSLNNQQTRPSVLSRPSLYGASSASNTSTNNPNISSYSASGGGGSFSTSVEKTTKAIKLHSIKSKPERDPGKRRDPEYQAWLQQQEFNPFLKNAWLLLGKSEYQDGDYLQSVSTFAHIIRIYKTNPEIVAEARMWMAKANVAMGWMYEAEDIFNQIRLAGGIPEDLKHEYNKIYADFLIKKEEYSQAIPFLVEAIEKEGDRLQKTRIKYLLGQIYQKEGNREKAYAAFESVHGMSTPYLYSFNARIQQSAFVDSSNKQQVLSMLNKMSKDHKNKDYLDQVYYAVGNIYLNSNDTIKAIDNYKKSLEKSTRNGFDKGLTDVTLGNIYFTQRRYIEAQPCYSEALDLISKNHEAYPLVALRSAVLDELVVYVKAVHLQDSLQTLARMPEDERLIAVNKIIEDLKKKEKEEKEAAERQELLAQREGNIPTSSPLFEQKTPEIPTSPIVTGGDGTSFYFYNPQIVTQGKAAFQRKWGSRKLEDHWRRKNKQVLSFTEEAMGEIENDSIQSGGEESIKTGSDGGSVESDIYSPQFYLQQIPLTPEAIEASNAIIEDAYFNMGLIYKDKLGDYNLAIDAFNTDLRRFPDTPNLEEIYYQLFLIYLRLGDKNMTEIYRRNLLNSFPESSYAAALMDSNYEWNMLNMHQMEGELYQQTYDYYLAGHVDVVRTNYASMKEKYPLSTLMPKFAFLNALTYAQKNDSEGFKVNLRNLIDSYPNADVTPLASEMLKGLLSGKELSSDSAPFRGMIWDIKFGGDSIDVTTGFDFIADNEAEYMLLFIFKPNQIDRNRLIYEVANYNFSKYVYQTFDLSFSTNGPIEMLQVRGFKDLKEIIQYLDKAFEKNSLMSGLDPSIIPVPISTDNYIALMNGRSLNQYFIFLEENYTNEMLTLIRYWTQQREGNLDQHTINTGEEETLPGKPEGEKTETEISPVTKPEPIPVQADTIKSLKPQEIPDSPLLPKEETQKDSHKNEFGIGDILSGDKIDKADDMINKATEIIENPVDGLKNLLKSTGTGDNLTKEEKEAEKQARKLQKEQEKARKAEEKAKQKAIEDAEKMRQDSIRNIEREKIEAERAAERAKEDQVKATQKAKDDARKQREQELKEKEKAHKEEQKRKERERNEELKRREQERNERLKQRERERKEQLKKREEERKEKERQARQKK